jgi:hypothetical protein
MKTNNNTTTTHTMKTTRTNKTPKAQSRPDQHTNETATAVAQPAPAPADAKPLPPKIDLKLRRTRRTFNVFHMVNLIKKEAPDLAPLTSRVGGWLWLRFDGVQPPDVTARVAQLGFHWNNNRQVWQHPCGRFHRNPASYDPRARYGEQPLAA